MFHLSSGQQCCVDAAADFFAFEPQPLLSHICHHQCCSSDAATIVIVLEDGCSISSLSYANVASLSPFQTLLDLVLVLPCSEHILHTPWIVWLLQWALSNLHILFNCIGTVVPLKTVIGHEIANSLLWNLLHWKQTVSYRSVAIGSWMVYFVESLEWKPVIYGAAEHVEKLFPLDISDRWWTEVMQLWRQGLYLLFMGIVHASLTKRADRVTLLSTVGALAPQHNLSLFHCQC